MKSTLLLTILAISLSSNIATAQSGLEAGKLFSKDKTDIVIDDTLPKIPKIDLSGNPIDTSEAETTSTKTVTPSPTTPALSNPATVTNPYMPESGPLTLLNCSGRLVSIETYNSNDTVMWVPFKKVSLAHGKSSQLKCATSKCKIKIKSKNITTRATTNYKVLKSNLLPTNKAAINAGCSAY